MLVPLPPAPRPLPLLLWHWMTTMTPLIGALPMQLLFISRFWFLCIHTHTLTNTHTHTGSLTHLLTNTVPFSPPKTTKLSVSPCHTQHRPSKWNEKPQKSANQIWKKQDERSSRSTNTHLKKKTFKIIFGELLQEKKSNEIDNETQKKLNMIDPIKSNRMKSIPNTLLLFCENKTKQKYKPLYFDLIIYSRVYASIPICPKQFAWNSPRVTRKWANPNHSPIQRQQPHILHWCTHSLDVSKR